ncbi:MAG: TetR/AcrR family transcriptional regulator [Planctomycetaceae bacterium]|nr:TetR/AcrR family transcriptional regulator [Planctomycetaceae bacterium]
MIQPSVKLKAETRRKLKTERKREAILRSAAAAFAQKGYYGTSMEDIAERLLMTKGSLYYYFKDKEEILFACHDYSLNLVLDNLEQVEAMDAPTDEKLACLTAAHVDVMLDALQGSAMALDFSALSEPLLKKIIAKRDRFERGLRSLIKRGTDEGIFRTVDAKLAVFMLLGAINWIAKWYRAGGSYDAKAIGKAYADIFVSALKSGKRFEFEIPDFIGQRNGQDSTYPFAP